MSNKDERKLKYYNIGFIIGIIPYLLLIILTDDLSLKKILLVIGFITAIINGNLLKYKYIKKSRF